MRKKIVIDWLMLASAVRCRDGSIRVAYLPPGTAILAQRDVPTGVEIDVEIPDDGEDIRYSK